MDALNLTDGDFSHRKEIIQLLKMVISQRWAFSYVRATGKKLSSQTINLVGVDSNEGNFTVAHERSIAEMESREPLMFRAQSGGVSIIFQSRLRESLEEDSISKSSALHYFELPYKVACTQLRKTVRVNLEAIAEVPVVLYLVNGALIEGAVMDISIAGAKFKVNQDIGQELRNPEVLDACNVSLPNGEALQSGAQLIDMVTDAESGTSYLRCQFVHMRPQDEEMLDGFINDMLRQIESLAVG